MIDMKARVEERLSQLKQHAEENQIRSQREVKVLEDQEELMIQQLAPSNDIFILRSKIKTLLSTRQQEREQFLMDRIRIEHNIQEMSKTIENQCQADHFKTQLSAWFELRTG